MTQNDMLPPDVKETLVRRFWEHVSTYFLAYVKIGVSAFVAGVLSLTGDLQKMDAATVNNMTWRDWTLLVLVTLGAIGNNILASLSSTFSKARSEAAENRNRKLTNNNKSITNKQ